MDLGKGIFENILYVWKSKNCEKNILKVLDANFSFLHQIEFSANVSTPKLMYLYPCARMI